MTWDKMHLWHTSVNMFFYLFEPHLFWEHVFVFVFCWRAFSLSVCDWPDSFTHTEEKVWIDLTENTNATLNNIKVSERNVVLTDQSFWWVVKFSWEMHQN